MKIGVATWFGTGNFGTDLQCFAFCRYLQNKGHQVYLIPLFHYNLVGCKYSIRRFLGNIKNFIKAWFHGSRTKMLRLGIVLEYKRKYLNIYPLVTTKHGYAKLLNRFDCFFSGSDQIWNPYHLFTFYLLDFANNKPRFAYASSVGVTEIPKDKYHIYINNLSKFRFIGIREKTGVETVNKILGCDKAVQVLDPTFLLSCKEWLALSKDIDLKNISTYSYMLVYLIGRRNIYTEYIEQIKKNYKINEVVIVNSVEGIRYSFASITLDKVSPLQFIRLLANARLVCTDSFHATALSINMNLNFINLLRFDDSGIYSQNSRIYDVLHHFNLSDRIYEGKNLPEEQIEWDKINCILNNDRVYSNAFIDTCLSSVNK